MGRVKVMLALIFVLLQSLVTSSLSRQKRCIVIQKQSGTHGDSAEGGDGGGDGGGDEDRDDEPRKPDKRNDGRYDRRNVERISPDSEFLRYRSVPAKKLDDVMRYKSKLASLRNRFV